MFFLSLSVHEVVRCVVCGKECAESLCSKCAVEKLNLALVDNIEVIECSSCGRYKKGGRWVSSNLNDVLKHEILKNIKIDENFNLHSMEIFSREIVLYGSYGGEEITYRVPFNFKIKKMSCERCSRQSGGYYEAIVQIRTKDRRLDDEEVLKTVEILNAVLEAEGDNDFAFVSKIEEKKEGIDVFVGGRDVGRKISYKIASEFGGKVFESKKLHTRIDGQNAYRFTYLVRIPSYKKGDVVLVKDRLAVVTNVKLGKGTDLITGKTLDIKDAKVVVKKEELMKGIIVNFDEHAAEVMCESGLVVVEKPFRCKVGDEAKIFEFNGKYWAFVL
ncbi:MAG: NMD3-related protein [Archaeoglobaceae archaeon]